MQQQQGQGSPKGGYSSERRLYPPRLPAPAQSWLGARVPGASKEVGPRDPRDGGIALIGGKNNANGAKDHQKNEGSSRDESESMKRAKYAGRALAEWSLVVAECNNFVERRRAEGVPSLKWVEVPTLGVEGFRRFG